VFLGRLQLPQMVDLVQCAKHALGHHLCMTEEVHTMRDPATRRGARRRVSV